MVFTGITFAEGSVPAVAGTLWTVPAATTDYVKSIIFSNMSGSSVNVTLWKRSNSNDRQILQMILDAGETLAVENLLLAAGDSLKAVASVGTSIDYIAQGVREA